MLFCIVIILLTCLLLGLAAGMPISRMYYTNFDHAITEKYHVILEGWPLEKFCSPSDIASRNEVSVLMASFESGATRFRKLSPTEFEKWTEKRLTNPADNSSPVTSSSSLPSSLADPTPTDDTPGQAVPPPSVPHPGSQESSSSPQETISNERREPSTGRVSDPDLENIPPQSTVPAKRKQGAEHPSSRPALANAFINAGVTSSNGATVMVNAKTRKPRADKGKKRGPWAK